MIYDGEKETYTISIDFRDKRTGSRIHEWTAIEKRMGHHFIKEDNPSPISAEVKPDGEFTWSRS